MLTACGQIDPSLKLGTQDQSVLATNIAQAQSTTAQIHILELQLVNLRNQRDEQLGAIWEMVKRARATIKGFYGDDSSEYELVGGKRLSERKKTTRKAARQEP
ncbi:MAG: hypothetical protein ACJ8CR_20665 [Roseiflexaceae bacterium]